MFSVIVPSENGLSALGRTTTGDAPVYVRFHAGTAFYCSWLPFTVTAQSTSEPYRRTYESKKIEPGKW